MKTRRYTPSSSSHVEEKSLQQLPFDLIVEIFTKLPARSIARFRCLSKVYASTFISPNFTESFLTISSSRPKLLLTCLKDGETFFFSSPQPQTMSPNTLVTASFHKSFPINCPAQVCRSVCGLVCGLDQRKIKGVTVTKPLICNPSTGQSLSNLPRVKTKRKQVISYLGYDPNDKQFKVFCMTQVLSGLPHYSEEHQVLTLEVGNKMLWRMIKCDLQHSPTSVDYRYSHSIFDGICINGVLYYLAFLHQDYDGLPDIVCFDIRSEKFSYIKKYHQGMKINNGRETESTLVNYKGKLAKLQANNDYNQLTVTGIQLWVLEDAQKHQWSSYIYILPPPWKNEFLGKLCFVGMTGKGEIVLSPKKISDSFYLLYYNPKADTVTRVEVQGMQDFEPHRADIFLDHVEDVKLMASV